MTNAVTTPAEAPSSSVARSWSWRAASAPLAVAGGAIAGLVMVGVRDPHAAGNYPSCPSFALFGVHCPGCGSMRALHELVHADIAGVFSRNILVPFGLILLVWGWVAWFDRRLGRARVPALRAPVPVLYASVVLLVVFSVLRNLPMSPFSGLAP